MVIIQFSNRPLYPLPRSSSIYWTAGRLGLQAFLNLEAKRTLPSLPGIKPQKHFGQLVAFKERENSYIVVTESRKQKYNQLHGTEFLRSHQVLN
jgi:hypothetical protein